MIRVNEMSQRLIKKRNISFIINKYFQSYGSYGRVIVVNGSTTYGRAAKYHCLPQYERIGIFLRKCLDTGYWTDEEPKCEYK